MVVLILIVLKHSVRVVILKTKLVTKEEDLLNNMKAAQAVTPDMMQREQRCIVHYNNVRRIDMERREIKRLMKNRKYKVIREHE